MSAESRSRTNPFDNGAASLAHLTHAHLKQRGCLGDAWFLDEVFIEIRGELHDLWRAVDEGGDTIDFLMQKRRNKEAARRFFRKLLKG